MSAVILRFPSHTCASSFEGTSKASSEIRPSELRIMGKRHLYGTELRSFHFWKAVSRTPSDCATWPITSQSNVVFIAHYSDKSSESQRQIDGRFKALKCLPKDMADDDYPIGNEEAAIRERAKTSMKAYRASRNWSMKDMASYLGVTAKNYEKYEGDPARGVPLSVIARFCRYSGVELEWIMLGKKLRKVI